ncbi:MAG: hypothetical protein IJ038_06350 [Clostridia bacterium]|nr:hypothetical protein [Clostridia bacterium]
MFYYLLLFGACTLSCIQVMFQKATVKRYGSGLINTYRAGVISAIVFLLIMFAVGKRITLTPFSFGLAIFFALINIVCIYFAFSVMKIGILSRYSLFLNLGGLVIPFIYGVLFNGDPLTAGKIICLVLVIAALMLNIDFKSKDSKKAIIYYLVVFCLNGLACVTLAFHQNNPWNFEIISSESFTMLYMVIYGLMSLAIYIAMSIKAGKQEPIEKKWLYIGLTGGSGVLYGFANLTSTICLLHVEPSMQYPIMTGGAIVLAGIAGLFFKEKITWKYIVSCILVIVGTTAILL